MAENPDGIEEPKKNFNEAISATFLWETPVNSLRINPESAFGLRAATADFWA
jgi:hypothetical protein